MPAPRPSPWALAVYQRPCRASCTCMAAGNVAACSCVKLCNARCMQPGSEQTPNSQHARRTALSEQVTGRQAKLTNTSVLTGLPKLGVSGSPRSWPWPHCPLDLYD